MDTEVISRSNRITTPSPAPIFVDEPIVSVNWRAVMAGAVSVIATQIPLTLLGSALGLTLFHRAEGFSGVRNIGIFTSIWALVSILGSVFLGGLIAGLCARHSTRTGGFVEGLLVWGVALLASTWFFSAGIPSMFSVMATGPETAAVMPTIYAQSGTVLKDIGHYGLVNGAHRIASLWTLFAALVMSGIAAVAGGAAGARTNLAPFWRTYAPGTTTRTVTEIHLTGDDKIGV